MYLGGLGDNAGGTLSPHLASRHEVGRVLASGPVPLTELRAAVVIGSGSASFEMLRHLVEVLPVMTTRGGSRRACSRSRCATCSCISPAFSATATRTGSVFEIGGDDVVTYHEMMDMYAHAAGLRKRVIVPVPVLSPRLSSLWVGLVTPIPADLARPLIDSLVNEVVVHDHAIDKVVPHDPIGCREAIELALRRVGDVDVVHPLDRRRAVRPHARRSDADRSRTGLARRCSATVRTSTRARRPRRCIREVCALGGDRGWLVGTWLWAVRGGMDRIVGGVGMRRGRRHPTDCASVTLSTSGASKRIEPARLLRLRAEMRLPGDAWLEWSIRPRTPTEKERCSFSVPCSVRAGCSVAPIGTRSRRSTGSSSGRSPRASPSAPKCSSAGSARRGHLVASAPQAREIVA